MEERMMEIIKKNNSNGINKKSNIYFISFLEYCEHFNIEKTTDSYYFYLEHSIKNFKNPILSSYCEYILSSDKSYEIDDIVSECFMYSCKRDLESINIYNVRNFIINIYDKVNATKRKHIKDCSFNIEEIFNECVDLNDVLFANNLLSPLNKEDREYVNLYFYQGYTYEQITEIMPIKTKRGVKKRIDTIIKKLRDTL